ncbi:MAG: S9 family peptidase [Bacteroidales bacterium]
MLKKTLTLATLISVFCSLSAQIQTVGDMSLDLIYKSKVFTPKGIQSIHPMGDGEHYCVLEEGQKLVRYQYGSITGETLIDISNLENIDGIETDYIDSYTLSSNEELALLAFNTDKIYRHSKLSNYIVWDLKNNTGHKLSKNGKQQEASFSPDGQKIAFVRENNLFYVDVQSQNEVQITPDGIHNHIINGHTDWVYEEEFGFTKAFDWSPESDQLAYLKFNESEVSEYSMTIWGSLYPVKQNFKYPKAGESNSVISAHVYNLNTQQLTNINLGDEIDVYIPRIFFSPINNEVVLYHLNRLQNQFKILLCNTQVGTVKTMYQETNPAYIDITDNFYFFKDGKQFVIASEQNGYNHLYLYNTSGKQIRQITQGNWDVTKLYGVDEQNSKIYFQANYSAPYNKEVLSCGLNGKNRIVLNKSQGEGSTNAQFSEDFSYVIYTYSNANRCPMYSLYKLTPNGEELLTVLEDNKAVEQAYKEHHFVEKTISSFVTDSGDLLYYWMMKPSQMETGKKYPMLMFVYGGPSSQEVNNQYGRTDYLWYQMLVQKGYVIVCVDNRGTTGRGASFRRETYMELGKKETVDQILAAKHFGKLSYIDPARIGIWGWSYGGFMAANCLFKGNDVFKMGIAVAPVSHWKYYDNVYTERYMQRPYDNPQGYEANAPIQNVDKLKGAFLLIHGTADDNVHFQQTLDLATALKKEGKQFEKHIYPNKNHSIIGGNTREHLYTKLSQFIYDNL